MKPGDILGLQFVPANKRKYLYPCAAAAVALVFLAAFMILSGLISDADDRIGKLAQRHNQIIPLVREIKALQSTAGQSLRPMEPLAASQQISRDLRLEANLASVRPVNLVGEKEGVQVFFESLDLDQLVDLLISLESRGGLQVYSYSLSRRMDKPQLADLQMVLTR